MAIHLGHHNPPHAGARRSDSAAFGARAVHPDGDDARTGEPHRSGRPRPGRTLVLGGARSGKSSYAERLLADRDRVTYVATAGARPDDQEWRARVRLHRSWRPPTPGSTLETTDIAAVLRRGRPTTRVLVDCLTLWLTAGDRRALDGWEPSAESRPTPR